MSDLTSLVQTPPDQSQQSPQKGPEWVPLADVVSLLNHPDFYWGVLDCRVKYLQLRVDTRDNLCLVKDRNDRPISLDLIQERIAKLHQDNSNEWMRGMNENAKASQAGTESLVEFNTGFKCLSSEFMAAAEVWDGMCGVSTPLDLNTQPFSEVSEEVQEKWIKRFRTYRAKWAC